MSITFATHGMLWPRADIIREQVQVIEILVEDDVAQLVVIEDADEIEVVLEVCSND